MEERHVNVLFFLTPKSEVTYVIEDYKLSKVMDIMEETGYTALPMIDRQGRYVGSVTEGDILRVIREKKELSLDQVGEITAVNIPRKTDIKPVSGTADMIDMIRRALEQNYVPVVDDDNIFCGIITRRDIIQVCYAKAKQYLQKQEPYKQGLYGFLE